MRASLALVAALVFSPTHAMAEPTSSLEDRPLEDRPYVTRIGPDLEQYGIMVSGAENLYHCEVPGDSAGKVRYVGQARLGDDQSSDTLKATAWTFSHVAGPGALPSL